MDEDKQTQTPVESKQELPKPAVAQEATEPKAEAQEADQALTEGKEGVKEAPAPSKTFTEAELEQRVATVKGGYDGTFKKMKDDSTKLRQELDAAMARLEDLKFSDFVKSVEVQGGDVNAAKQLVETQRQVATGQRELAKRQGELDEREAALNEAGKAKSAYDLAEKYGLGKEAVPLLVKAQTFDAMRADALQLAYDKARSEKAPLVKIDSHAKSGKGLDVSKLPLITRAGMAVEGKI